MGLAACAPLPREPVANVGAWIAGPVRWLLVSEDRRRLREVRTQPELEAFITDFWARREPGLPVTFAERVEAADRLYSEPTRRGALSDRGGVLILLGSPATLRATSQSTPAWSPGRSAGNSSRFPTRPLRVEQWVYELAELPPGLAARLHEAGESRLAVSFLIEEDDVRLLGGEKLLELVRRSLLRP